MATHVQSLPRERRLGMDAVGAAVVAGAGAAVVMSFVAMLAATTYQGTGFFTPLYHIASSVIAPDAMMASMERASAGEGFYFAAGPAAVGMIVHVTVGIGYALLFALLVPRGRLVSASAAAALGAAFGVAVMLFSSFALLRMAAGMFGGGDPIYKMPQMVGWPTFTVEHVVYGLFLSFGYAALTRPAEEAPSVAA